MRRLKLILLLTLFALLSCKDPEWKEEYSWDLNSIPGTKQMQLPLTWEKGNYGGIWRDTYAEDPKSFNPFSNLDGTYTLVTNLILDYLFDYDPDTSFANIENRLQMLIINARELEKANQA